MSIEIGRPASDTFEGNVVPGSSVGATSSELDPRESMRVLPSFLQPFLTWLTGKPLLGEVPWNLTPIHHLLASCIPLLLGVAGSSIAVLLLGWWLLLLIPCWMLTVHGSRKLRTMILHQCSHTNFLAHKRVDTLLGETISIILMTQNYQEYKREHISDHHSSSHMTLADPTVQFILVSMGAEAGMTRAQLWGRLWKTIISPRFHLNSLYARLTSHFRGSSWTHRMMMIGYLLGQLGLAVTMQSWLIFLVAWFFPVGILFNVSACVRLSSRHIFPKPGVRQSGRAVMASFTHGIFIGEAVPPANLPLLHGLRAWIIWTLRMLFIHLPTRLFVLVGDGPCHDYHHRYPRSRNWSNYIFARNNDLIAGHPGWPPYTEVWGLFNAINEVFCSLSAADPHEYSVARLKTVKAGELLAALEE